MTVAPTDPFLRVLPLAGQAARTEAERCLYCVDAACTRACPTQIDGPSGSAISFNQGSKHNEGLVISPRLPVGLGGVDGRPVGVLACPLLAMRLTPRLAPHRLLLPPISERWSR